jgi:hypothetical protein
MTSPTATPATPAQTVDLQYKNNKYGFSFSYPKGWKLREADPTTATADSENTEFALWIEDGAAKERVEAALVTISKMNLTAATGASDGAISSEGGKSANYKQTLTVSGKSAVKYTVPQSSAANREIYIIGYGDRSLTIQSINEESNLARNPSYMKQFDAIVESIKLP